MDPDRPHRRESSSRVHLLEEELTHEITGGFFETYNELGFGFREGIYKRGLEITLRRRGLLVEREVGLLLHFGPTARFFRVLGPRKLIVPRSDPENPGNPRSPA